MLRLPATGFQPGFEARHFGVKQRIIPKILNMRTSV
jgi:hypothetical protein